MASSALVGVSAAAALLALEGAGDRPLRADAEAPGAASTDSSRAAEREAMVRNQLEARGLRDRGVLDAMRAVPRHRFVLPELRPSAYDDGPLPIGRGQTISQPYIVAFMAEALRLGGSERVLEVGSGSGYAAAVLSRLAAEVYGIEIEPELHARSVVAIEGLGYRNVFLRAGDGFHGWPERAPFDAILLSCAAEEIPGPLWEQLKQGGRFLYPKGPEGGAQQLVLVTKTAQGPREVRLEPVRFVPMRRSR
jgi:protein-L-isoaspartate(D-aspartate) O-methyltransferase